MHDKTVGLDFRNISVSSAIYIVGDVLTRGTSFLLIPLYTRFLSPAEYGNWGILLSLLSFLNILFSLQLGSALTVNYFNFLENQRKQLISTIWILILLSSACMSFLLLIIGRDWVSKLIQGESYPNFILVIGIAFLATFSVVPQTLMRLRQQAFTLVAVNVLLYLVGVIVGVYLLVQYKLGVTALLFGILVANLLSVIPYILILRNDLSLNISKNLARKSFFIALPILPHMVSHWGLNLMDRIILQAYLPLSDVGIYQLGYQLGAAFQIIIIAINNAWTPFFLENFQQAHKWRSIKSFSSWLVFIQVWIALFIVLFLPLFVRVAFSNEYFYSVNVIPWVVLGFLFVLFYQYWVNILFYYKKTALIPIATGIAALVNLILNLVLVPRFGFLASALITAVSYAVLAGITYFVASRLSAFSFEYSRWIKVGLTGGAIYFFVAALNFQSMFLSVLVRVVLFFSYPLILYFISFWRKNELDNAYLWLHRKGFL